MTSIDILLAVMIGGFGLQLSLLLVVWNSLNKRMDRIEARIDKLDEKVTDIDRRLCRIEGSMAAKECCMLKDERHIKKAK
jgi:chaperonin cofactor prefoldin